MMSRKSSSMSPMGKALRVCLLASSLTILVAFHLGQAQVDAATNSSGDGGDGATGNNRLLSTNLSSEARIGGMFAGRGEFPFHVGIYINVGTRYICSGALLGRSQILTTSACLSNSQGVPFKMRDLVVTVGDYNLLREDFGELSFKVGRIETDPNSGLALLFTTNLISFNSNEGPGAIRPIKLVSSSFNPMRGQLKLTGWGKGKLSSKLSTVLRVQDVSPEPQCKLPNRLLICSSQTDGPGPCEGDLGGPLFNSRDDEEPTLAGIFQGSLCDSCNNPSCDNEFISISKALPWIQSSL